MVCQEFKMHADQDEWRLYSVSKLLGSKTHPFHRFSIGNSDTLAAVNTTRLAEWFNSTYSANLMHISVFTALKCDQVVYSSLSPCTEPLPTRSGISWLRALVVFLIVSFDDHGSNITCYQSIPKATTPTILRRQTH